MKKLTFAISVLALSGVSASAADMAVKARLVADAAPYDWTGFYIGGEVGGEGGRTSLTHSPVFASPNASPIDAAAVTSAASPNLHPSGWNAGAYSGYNYQSSRIVWGIEADISAFHLRGSKSGVFPFPSTLPGGVLGPPTLTFNSNATASTDWLFTFRPRVGVALDSWLLYATGGLAVTEERINQVTTTFASSISRTQLGWTVGAGVEKAIGQNWILRAEFLHVDFGNSNGSGTDNIPAGVVSNSGCTAAQAAGPAVTGPVSLTGCSLSSRLTAEIGRIGISYKFGGPPVSRY